MEGDGSRIRACVAVVSPLVDAQGSRYGEQVCAILLLDFLQEAGQAVCNCLTACAPAGQYHARSCSLGPSRQPASSEYVPRRYGYSAVSIAGGTFSVGRSTTIRTCNLGLSMAASLVFSL